MPRKTKLSGGKQASKQYRPLTRIIHRRLKRKKKGVRTLSGHVWSN